VRVHNFLEGQRSAKRHRAEGIEQRSDIGFQRSELCLKQI
jgi:hypothetical protein